MGRAAKKKDDAATTEPDAGAAERKRLKKLAISKGLLSETPAAASTALNPSNTVLKHHGKDIIRKSQRKNRFLFSFPGLLAPISGGKVGDLKDLGTKNPILYLEFPQGQMKLFGTIVYPKNRYLTLQFSRGGKNVMCEDYFDNMIVFSDAWWIGKKDDNPEEARLEFPKELNTVQHEEPDFKGGAGASYGTKHAVSKPKMKCSVQQSPKTESEDDISDSQNNSKDLLDATPIRQSSRIAGKTLNYTEASPEEDSVDNDAETSEEGEKKSEAESPTRNYALGKIKTSSPMVFDIDNEDAAVDTHFSEHQSAVPATKSEELSCSNRTSLVQATISTMFKKVEEKKEPRNSRNSPSSKVSSRNSKQTYSKRKADQVKAGTPEKKGKVIKKRKRGTESKTRKKQPEVEEDEIEEFSSASQETDASDEEWAA